MGTKKNVEKIAKCQAPLTIGAFFSEMKVRNKMQRNHFEINVNKRTCVMQLTIASESVVETDFETI